MLASWRVVPSAVRLYYAIPITITDTCRTRWYFRSYIVVIDLHCPYSITYSLDFVRLVQKTLSTRMQITPYEMYTIDRTFTNVCAIKIIYRTTGKMMHADVKSREQPKHKRRSPAESRVASTNCIHTAPITRICVQTSPTVISAWII